MKTFKLRKSGFSLTEVLVALVVVSLGVLVVMGCFPLIARSTNKTTENRAMVILAQSIMDRLLMNNVFVALQPVDAKDLPPSLTAPLLSIGTVAVKYWGEKPEPTSTPKHQIVHVEVTLTSGQTARKVQLSGTVCP
jgi:prepilin-type N-terminal cleavage/methylation domain-containing protein